MSLPMGSRVSSKIPSNPEHPRILPKEGKAWRKLLCSFCSPRAVVRLLLLGLWNSRISQLAPESLVPGIEQTKTRADHNQTWA